MTGTPWALDATPRNREWGEFLALYGLVLLGVSDADGGRVYVGFPPTGLYVSPSCRLDQSTLDRRDEPGIARIARMLAR